MQIYCTLRINLFNILLPLSGQKGSENMKTIYVCEKCQALHNTKELALECESAHLTATEVCDYSYTNNVPMPCSVTISLSDGNAVTYYREV
jgi:hypothetical protein